ncbi:MAG: hypothetical protein ACE5J9_06350, partial [Methanosarcinales archaeon]
EEYCPICKKELEMEEVLEEIDEGTGIYVRTQVCPVCGEGLTDEMEYIRARKELNEQKNILIAEQNIIKLENSLALHFPKSVTDLLELHEKEYRRH